jgi:acyl carrier protein
MTGDARVLPDSPAIEDRILTLLRCELLSDGVAVDRETNLLSGELLDSMGVLRLAALVDEAFHIDIQPADFVIENFSSVEAIAGFVRRRLADRVGAGHRRPTR